MRCLAARDVAANFVRPFFTENASVLCLAMGYRKGIGTLYGAQVSVFLEKNESLLHAGVARVGSFSFQTDFGYGTVQPLTKLSRSSKLQSP